MKRFLLVSLLTAAAIAPMSGFGGMNTASAAVFCSKAVEPCNSPYSKGTVIEANLLSGTKWKLNPGFWNIACEEASIKGEVTSAGGGSISSLGFGKCNATIIVVKPGFFSTSSPSGGSGPLTLEGFEITVSLGSTSCTYGGSISSTLSGGPAPTIKVNAEVNKTAGGFACASPGHLEAEYAVTAPQPLYVEGSEEVTICKTIGQPCNGSYGSATALEATLKPGTKWELKAGFSNVVCEEAFIKGEVTNPGPVGGISGALLWLGFDKCTSTVEVRKEGTFSVSSPSGGGGTFSLEGFHIEVIEGATHCLYGGPSSTTLSGGAAASIQVSTTMTKVEGSASCAASAAWTAEYTVASPQPLYVDGSGGVALCETANHPCNNAYPKGSPLIASLKSGTKWELKAGFATIACEEASIKGELSTPGPSGPISGPVSSFSLGKCGSATVEVLKAGTFTLRSPKASSEPLILEGFEIKVTVGGTSCTYGGPASAALSGRPMASVKANTSLLFKAGSGSCASPAAWSAEYTVTAPEPLYLQPETAVLCKTSGEPCSSSYSKGTAVAAGLKSGKWVLKAGFANVTCEEATIGGEVTNPGSTGPVTGTASSLGFGKCGSFKVSVLKTGTFSIGSLSGGNGILNLEGFEITTALGSTACIYGGPASFSLVGGSMASLESTGSLAKTGGGVLCANPAKLEAVYTATAPEPLYVEIS